MAAKKKVESHTLTEKLKTRHPLLSGGFSSLEIKEKKARAPRN